ncbi:MAG: hypothetical protein ACI3WR_01220 [Oscillospiraceae bacterium]
MKKEFAAVPSAASTKASFSVAAVWFGTLVGPSLVTGAYTRVYFAPYGALGLVLPFVAFLPICILAAMGAEVVRRNQAYDYASFGKALYGKYHRFLMPLLDYYIVLAMIIGGSAVANVEGLLLSAVLGISPIVGASIFGLITVIVAVFGARVLRKFSSVMTVLLFIAFFALAVLFILRSPTGLQEVIAGGIPEGASVRKGLLGAVLMGFSNMGCVCGTLCAVEQNIKTAKQASFVGVFSFILNSAIFLLSCVMILPYCPEALSSPTPTVYIIDHFMGSSFPWLYTAYNGVMFFALLSSDAPQLFAVSSRIIGLLDRHHKWERVGEKKKIAVIGLIYEGLCVAISSFGLTAIISKGYSFNGWMGLFLVAVPLLGRIAGYCREKRGSRPEGA